MTKLNGHYLGLLINAALLGPLWGALLFALLTVAITGALMLLWLAPFHMDVLLKLLWGAYRIGFVPALITSALIWALQLRRNWVGVIVTVVLGFIGTGVSAYFLCDNLLAFILIHIAGTLSALFFSFLLPRPEATSSPLNLEKS